MFQKKCTSCQHRKKRKKEQGEGKDEGEGEGEIKHERGKGKEKRKKLKGRESKSKSKRKKKKKNKCNYKTTLLFLLRRDYRPVLLWDIVPLDGFAPCFTMNKAKKRTLS